MRFRYDARVTPAQFYRGDVAAAFRDDASEERGSVKNLCPEDINPGRCICKVSSKVVTRFPSWSEV